MKKLFLFLTLISALFVEAQFTPTTKVNYVKFEKVPPIGVAQDSVLVYSPTDLVMKMVPRSTLATGAVIKLDEGNGYGLVIKGRDATKFGNVGLNAVDLSYATTGSSNGATGLESTVGGGKNNTASASQSVIAGGNGNISGGNQSTVGGGNSNNSGGFASTIAGGSSNLATGGGDTISGGTSNQATGGSSTVSGGATNQATGLSSTTSGGQGNIAGGRYSVVSGGIANQAQTYGEWVGGVYSTIASGSATTFVGTDRIFNIGNGTSTTASNAFTILKNGLATLPSVTNALITAGSVKSIVTKEWFLANLPTGGGTVTNVTGVAANGFTWSIATSTTTPAITLNLQDANTSQSGKLTASDWNYFNNKFPLTGGAITGIGGNGFIGLIPQTSDPATPASGVSLFSRSTGAFSWKGTNGFRRSFIGTGIAADRDYTLPDANGTIVLNDNSATITNKTISFAGNTFDILPFTNGGTGLSTLGTSLQIPRTNTGVTGWEWHTFVKSDIGLSNVDNTSDSAKPVSTATTTAINAKRFASVRFIASALTAPLDNTLYNIPFTNNMAPSTTATRSIKSPITCTGIDFSANISTTSILSSSEPSTIILRNITAGTSITLTSALLTTVINSGVAGSVSFTINQGDEIDTQWQTPTWSMNPTNCYISIDLALRN